MPIRDVDKLEAVPDGLLLQQDMEYMAKHKLDQLMGELITDILKQKPHDPLQFIIDSITLGPEDALQDEATGLPSHRRHKLERVFKIIDKDGSGRVSLRTLQNYASKYGGETLTLDDLRALFDDFKPNVDGIFGLKEFLIFFSRVSSTMPNSEFDAMVTEMSS